MELIPAIDIINGQCVRLSKGDYSQCKAYPDSPLHMAKVFEDLGIRRLHMVDLDGARAAHAVNLQTLERIATQTSLLIDFGGGIKSREDLQRVFDCGATYATIGSIAITNPHEVEAWVAEYGAQQFILGADCRNERIRINGWIDDTEEDVYSFIRHYQSLGINKVLCTDIEKDGMLAGPSFNLYQNIKARCPGITLIASGGVSSIDDVMRLDEMGVCHVILGKALYENHIDLKELVAKFDQHAG